MLKKLIILVIFTLLFSGCSLFGGDSEEETAVVEQVVVLAPPTAEEIQNLADEIEVIIKTQLGSIAIELLPDRSPYAVANFVNLVKAKYYQGIKFHRVVPNFIIQAGDPRTNDNYEGDKELDGPGFYINREVSLSDEMISGAVAMANDGPNAHGSQFFIVVAENGAPWLSGRHIIFGKVTQGLNTAQRISTTQADGNGRPLNDIVIETIILNEIRNDEPAPAQTEGEEGDQGEKSSNAEKVK